MKGKTIKSLMPYWLRSIFKKFVTFKNKSLRLLLVVSRLNKNASWDFHDMLIGLLFNFASISLSSYLLCFGIYHVCAYFFKQSPLAGELFQGISYIFLSINYASCVVFLWIFPKSVIFKILVNLFFLGHLIMVVSDSIAFHLYNFKLGSVFLTSGLLHVIYNNPLDWAWCIFYSLTAGVVSVLSYFYYDELVLTQFEDLPSYELMFHQFRDILYFAVILVVSLMKEKAMRRNIRLVTKITRHIEVLDLDETTINDLVTKNDVLCTNLERSLKRIVKKSRKWKPYLPTILYEMEVENSGSMASDAHSETSFQSDSSNNSTSSLPATPTKTSSRRRDRIYSEVSNKSNSNSPETNRNIRRYGSDISSPGSTNSRPCSPRIRNLARHSSSKMKGYVSKIRPDEVVEKEGTYMVVEIEGFGNIQKNLERPDLIKVLKDYHHVVYTSVNGNGGVVDTLSGDMICCSWNCSKRSVDHQIRACKAAVRVKEKHEKERNELYGVNICISISSSNVLSGVVGVKQMKRFSTFGPCEKRAKSMNRYNRTGIVNERQRKTTILIDESVKSCVNYHTSRSVCDIVCFDNSPELRLLFEVLDYFQQNDEWMYNLQASTLEINDPYEDYESCWANVMHSKHEAALESYEKYKKKKEEKKREKKEDDEKKDGFLKNLELYLFEGKTATKLNT